MDYHVVFKDELSHKNGHTKKAYIEAEKTIEKKESAKIHGTFELKPVMD